MTLKHDIKSVALELSPILAGFKLGVIVIGYLGLGSVAKWVISYWYPFTRLLWDSVAHFLSLPIFPVIVKDSLTALVFFLPLGMTAIWQKLSGKTDSNDSHRIMGAVFGLLFLFIICKDVMSSILSSLALSIQSLSASNIAAVDIEFAIFITFYLLLAFLLGILLRKARRASVEGKSFLSRVHRSHKRAQSFILSLIHI